MNSDSSADLPTLGQSLNSNGCEVATILFFDLVGYSMEEIHQQANLLESLQSAVRASPEFRAGGSTQDVISLPTGDGLALVFFRDPTAAVRCALDVSSSLRQHRHLKLRTGIHIGPVRRHADIRKDVNLVGGGINIAQRVMDCGDAGHILLSRSLVEILEQLTGWRECLEDLGLHRVKHGVVVHLFNLCKDGLGNSSVPTRLARASIDPPFSLAKVPAALRRHSFANGVVLLVCIVVGAFMWLRFAQLIVIIKLYLPALLAICATLCFFKLKVSGTIVSHRAELVRARSLLVAFSVGCVLMYGIYDYSGLFPKHLYMEVFYDEEGVDRTLRELCDQRDIKALRIVADYKAARDRYFRMLDTDVKALFDDGRFFSVQEGGVHSEGHTSFIVKKVDMWQTYHIEQSRGELVHSLETPRSPTRQFYTRFEKLQSADDYIRTSVPDLMTQGKILVRPQFKQMLAQTPTSKSITFNVVVVGVTRLSIFPWPTFSATLYCARFPDGLVPLAYAIYKN